MIRFLCSSSRSAFLQNRVLRSTQLFGLQFDFVELCCHQNHPFVSNFNAVRSFASKGLSNSDEQQDVLSSSVSYLVKSCGLSTENAISVCKSSKLDRMNPEKADSVLSFFRDHGFTDAQITRFVRKYPKLLRADPDKNLKPKFEFFYSKGISRSQLPSILASNPTLLHRSLENNLIPSFNFLKSVSYLDDHKVIMALRHWQRSPGSKASNSSMQDNLVPNLALLRRLGVPQASISLLLTFYLVTACCEPTKFGELVDKVKEMGFNRDQASMFFAALHVVSTVKEPRWESKIEIYRRYGWSREDVLSTFRKNPWFMHASEKKIEMVLDFVINKMGWSAQDIATYPSLLCYSLEKRIMPRCYVSYVLSSKGIITKDVKLSSLIMHTEKDFLQKFVTKYGEAVPELLDVYQGKINPLEATI